MCLLFPEQTSKANPGWRGSLDITQGWAGLDLHKPLRELSEEAGLPAVINR